MDMKIEVVPLPVRDVDAAKAFYTEQVGFPLDHDVEPGNGMRVVQMTPPGSACSVVIGVGLPLGEPGSRYAFFDDPDGNGWAIQEYKR
jgi:catechol 2,3-dioxygenase-like lactoylglutathione lyase family enzyme